MGGALKRSLDVADAAHAQPSWSRDVTLSVSASGMPGRCPAAPAGGVYRPECNGARSERIACDRPHITGPILCSSCFVRVCGDWR